MKNISYTILAIGFCLLAGKILYNLVGGLPASLYGMILYCFLLQLGWLRPHRVQQANQWAIKHMGVCFIPAAVGVINHFELFKHHGYAIVLIIFVTTFVLIAFVGIMTERYLSTHTKPRSN